MNDEVEQGVEGQVKEDLQTMVKMYQSYADNMLALKRWVEDHFNVLARIGAVPSRSISWYSCYLDFDDLPREKALELMMALGGKWDKSVNGTKIDYRQVVDGVMIRLWRTPPPPSCRLIEKSIVVPPQPEKVVVQYELDCRVEDVL